MTQDEIIILALVAYIYLLISTPNAIIIGILKLIYQYTIELRYDIEVCYSLIIYCLLINLIILIRFNSNKIEISKIRPLRSDSSPTHTESGNFMSDGDYFLRGIAVCAKKSFLKKTE